MAEALLRVINGILDFSKIEAGELHIEEVGFDLRSLLDETVGLFALQARSKGLVLTCNLASDLPQIMRGDPGRLRQVLINLLGNALKFTEHGEIMLRVSREDGGDQHIRLSFAVSDTGIGISPEKHSAIFESFKQGDGSTTRKYGGTGLGLAISRRLVELMGGNLWMESAEGCGSNFYFTANFKVTPDSLPAAAKPVSQMPAPIGSIPARILLAEDNPVNQKLASILLKRMGHNVFVVANGSAAVTAWGSQTFDLILMDLQMPEMDGFEAVARIRAREQPTGSRIPIIAVTAHAMNGDRERCLQAGMDDYISKPIQAHALASCIQTALEQGRECRTRRSAPDAAKIPACTLDEAELWERVGHDPVLLREMLDLFRQNSSLWLQEIRSAIVAGEGGELAAAAHGLKGSLSNFAANGACKQAQQLEELGLKNRCDEGAAICALLEREIADLEAHIATLISVNEVRDLSR